MTETTILNTGRNKVGGENPVYFIADIAANHDGDIERAKDLIFLCAEAGAHAAKFQNFNANTIVSDLGFKNLGDVVAHQKNWGSSVYEIYEKASISLDWCATLKETCDIAGIDYFTAPYDPVMIPELSKYVCAWKLGSGDITWYEEIEEIAKDGKPFFIATGASEIEEVEAAMQVARKHTNKICIMQCNTNYTASLENFKHISLNVLKTYSVKFPGVVLGLSDHTPGHATVLGAVALGARAIEKHFTDNINREGPDHKFSMSPSAWLEMVQRTRELQLALGSTKKRVMENEKETVVIQRRAIRANKALYSGDILVAEHLAVLRPCPPEALPPFKLGELMGKKLKKDIVAGEIVRLSDVE